MCIAAKLQGLRTRRFAFGRAVRYFFWCDFFALRAEKSHTDIDKYHAAAGKSALKCGHGVTHCQPERSL
jgi:hypothetical protein